jgi:hypothetical protein
VADTDQLAPVNAAVDAPADATIVLDDVHVLGRPRDCDRIAGLDGRGEEAVLGDADRGLGRDMDGRRESPGAVRENPDAEAKLLTVVTALEVGVSQGDAL